MALSIDMIWETKTPLGLLKKVHPSKVEANGIIAATASCCQVAVDHNFRSYNTL